MARIPDETVDHIRQQANIVDVVSQYVQLRKSGQNHFAHCPFHEDKTPSFSVNEKKQMYYCFSCGRGGNVFSFLQEVEGLSYPEAIIKAAETVDIDIDDSLKNQVTQTGPKEDSRKGKLLAIHEKAKEFYHHILMNTQIGEAAYEYLINRGMTDELLKEFQIGFSPPRRNAFHLYLTNQDEGDFAEDILRATGIFSDPREGQEEQYLDRFFNRIMFPIRDAKGNTVAFSGRVFEENTDPNFRTAKYMNSPETELFNKRRVLFNYDKARAAIRREGEVILFEGFMDVISSWQAGVKNGIASMGTSLTNEQVGALDRVTDKVVIAYDGDNAGLEATKRAADYFANETHFSIEIATFPENLDPDDYIKTKGIEAYKEFLNHGRDTMMSFLMRYHQKEANLENESERISYIDTVLHEMTRVTSAVEREVYFNQLAETFGLSVEPLKEQFQEYMLEAQQKRTRELKQENQEKQQQQVAQVAVRPRFTNEKKEDKIDRAEQRLLYRLFYHDEVWTKLQQKEFDFWSEEFKTLFILYESYFIDMGNEGVDGFLDFVSDQRLKQIVAKVLYMEMDEEYSDTELNDCMYQIMEVAPIEKKLEEKKQALEEAKRKGETNEQNTLAMEIIQLRIQLEQKSRKIQTI
jgi:DNA primase